MKFSKNKINGWLSINKPYTVTSNDVLYFLKKSLSPSKIGHAGTLDPLATGVLPIAFGEATKTIQYLQESPKSYIFEITFGAETVTDDAEGEITKKTDKLPKSEDIEKVLPFFIGEIEQIPPKYSAIKINGRRAYDMARKGDEFEIKPRKVHVYDLKLEDYKESKKGFIQQATLFCKCSKGTYIRTIAKDIAIATGGLGYTSLLKRVSYGSFTLGKSLEINEIAFDKNAPKEKQQEYLHFFKEESIRQLKPVTVGLDDIPVIHVKEGLCNKLKNGVAVVLNDDYPKISHQLNESFELYSIFSREFPEKLVALARLEKGLLKPIKVFNL